MQCAVDGCRNRAKAKGFCLKHYRRWRKYGDPLFLSKQPAIIPIGRNEVDMFNTQTTRYLVQCTYEEQLAFVQEILDERMGL
jgi:hypothetical protein